MGDSTHLLPHDAQYHRTVSPTIRLNEDVSVFLTQICCVPCVGEGGRASPEQEDQDRERAMSQDWILLEGSGGSLQCLAASPRQVLDHPTITSASSAPTCSPTRPPTSNLTLGPRPLSRCPPTPPPAESSGPVFLPAQSRQRLLSLTSSFTLEAGAEEGQTTQTGVKVKAWCATPPPPSLYLRPFNPFDVRCHLLFRRGWRRPLPPSFFCPSGHGGQRNSGRNQVMPPLPLAATRWRRVNEDPDGRDRLRGKGQSQVLRPPLPRTCNHLGSLASGSPCQPPQPKCPSRPHARPESRHTHCGPLANPNDSLLGTPFSLTNCPCPTPGCLALLWRGPHKATLLLECSAEADK